MDINKILIIGLIVCSAIVIFVSIPHYILGEELAIAGKVVQTFSYVLGILFIIYIILAIMKKIWKNYKGITLIIWILGIFSVGFLLLTGMLVGWYALTGSYLPKSIAQSAIALRTISIYFGIAGILMLLFTIKRKQECIS